MPLNDVGLQETQCQFELLMGNARDQRILQRRRERALAWFSCVAPLSPIVTCLAVYGFVRARRWF